MEKTIQLSDGAPVKLPPGKAPWRVCEGMVEVYLVSTERRRLVALVPAGRHVFPVLDDAPLQIFVVAPGGARMIRVNAEDTGVPESAAVFLDGVQRNPHAWQEDGPAWGDRAALVASVQDCIIQLEEHHAAVDAQRDERDVGRLAARSVEHDAAPGTYVRGELQFALAGVGDALGITPRPVRDTTRAKDFSTVPQQARIAGFRARRIILCDGWWRLDLGPLIARNVAKGRIEALVRRRGKYIGAGGRPIDGRQANAYDAVAYVGHAPFAEGLRSLVALGRHILPDLRNDVTMVAAAALAVAIIGTGLPLATAWIFSEIVPAGSRNLLASVGVALLVAAVAQILFRLAQGWAAARIEGRSAIRLAAGVSDRILLLPARFFRGLTAGDFGQRLQGLEEMRELAVDVLLSSGATALFSIVYLAMLLVVDPRLALLALAVTLVFIAALVASRLMQIRSLREAAELEGRLAGITYEILEGIAKLRTAAAEWRAIKRWRSLYEREQAIVARGMRVANHFSAFTGSWQIMTLAALFAAAALLSNTGVSTGVFIGFLSAFGIFQASVMSFCEGLMRLLLIQPLAERARPILAAEPEIPSGRADPGELSGLIEASGVSFGYSPDGPPLIAGLDLLVRPGEHVAIVGASGSGKSTILRLLLGFEQPRTGVILYDRQELSGLDPARVRSQISAVLQTSALFAGTILENIRGAANISLEECLEAAEHAGLTEDLALFPLGVHTPITEGATTLSGGQRQRILIARALASRPRILFFDEATSALDNVVQAKVYETIDRLHVTRLTIAHRLSTVRKVDRICVLKDGRFAESGSYDELIAMRGLFTELAQRQLIGN